MIGRGSTLGPEGEGLWCDFVGNYSVPGDRRERQLEDAIQHIGDEGVMGPIRGKE